MKKGSVLLIYSILLSLLLACNSGKTKQNTEDAGTNVEYKIAKNYFIKNDVDGAIPDKITAQSEFEKYFGMAATMDPEGTPTPIDFSKEYVIVADYGVTVRDVILNPASLTLKEGVLNLEYKAEEGEEQGFTSRPFLLIVVANATQGEVTLCQVKSGN